MKVDREGKGGANSDRSNDLNDVADVVPDPCCAVRTYSTPFSAFRDKCGGLRISVPKARRAKDGTIPSAERTRLADTLGIPAHQSRANGVYIPADTSWMHEMLSRSYGDTPSPIREARYIVV